MTTGYNDKRIPLIDSFDRRDFLISRIISGGIRLNVNGEIVIFKYPNADIRYEACEIYNDIILNEDLFSEDDAVGLLIYYNLWSEYEEDLLKNVIPKDIEDFKLEMYNSVTKSNTLESLRKKLDIAKTKMAELSAKRNSLFHLTSSGIALYSKQLFILEKCINRSDLDINKVFDAYQKSIISEEDMRCLARTDPWRTIWQTSKKAGQLFPSELTDDQRRLSQWSIFYDNVYENPNCPSDDIIDDDDILDGWAIKQRKEIDAERNKIKIDKIVSKNSKADEFFILVETGKDAKKVFDMNTGISKAIQNSRLRAVLEKGEIKDGDLPDRKNSIRTDFNKMASERFRK